MFRSAAVVPGPRGRVSGKSLEGAAEIRENVESRQSIFLISEACGGLNTVTSRHPRIVRRSSARAGKMSDSFERKLSPNIMEIFSTSPEGPVSSSLNFQKWGIPEGIRKSSPGRRGGQPFPHRISRCPAGQGRFPAFPGYVQVSAGPERFSRGRIYSLVRFPSVSVFLLPRANIRQFFVPNSQTASLYLN